MSKTALVTGASGGLGKEFARLYAKMGYDVVLVARSENKLLALKDEIESYYHVKAYVIVEDLSDPDAGRRVYEKTKELGLTIDRLINNAGSGKMKTVAECDPQTLADIINLNVTSVTMLSHYFAADMVARKSGKILQVSSLGAFQPDPYFNVYGPSKAFELFLGATMYGELKGTGVGISVLCPGPVKTNWATNAGKHDARFAREPYEIAKAGVVGLERGQLVIVPTLLYKLERAVVTLTPKKVVASAIGKWQSGLRA